MGEVERVFDRLFKVRVCVFVCVFLHVFDRLVTVCVFVLGKK